MHVMPTMPLGSKEQQPIKGMTFVRTDFEIQAYGQGYSEENLRPVNAVTHLFGDGDLDAGHCKAKSSAAKEFMARKKPHGDCESSQAQEHQLEVIAMTNKLDKPQVEAKAMASRAQELTRTAAPGKVRGTYWDSYWDRIKCKVCFGNPT